MGETGETTLAFFSEGWQNYQQKLSKALAPLTSEQLAFRAAPHLRSIGELAMHIVAGRAYWFIEFLGEDGGEEMQQYVGWNEAALSLGAPIPSVASLVQGLEKTWGFMAVCLERWSPDEMSQVFPDEPVDVSRAWVVFHVLEHDLHHGGELSLTLGMQDIPVLSNTDLYGI